MVNAFRADRSVSDSVFERSGPRVFSRQNLSAMRSWQVTFRAITHRNGTDKNRSEPTTPDSDRFEFNTVPVLRLKDTPAGGARSVDKKSFFFSKSRTASRSTVTISEPRSTSSSPVSPTQSSDLFWAKRAFLDAFKDYEATSELDQIRKQYYSRLDLDQHVYLDYTGMFSPRGSAELQAETCTHPT